MSKKLQSSFANMVIVLFIVTFTASAAVGYINTLTAEPIRIAKEQKQTDAIAQVIPEKFDNNPSQDIIRIAINEGDTLDCFPAKKGETIFAYAIKTYTNNGFGGQVWIMLGIDIDGNITGYSVLEHKETPGLGSKMDVWFAKDGKGNIIGKNPANQELKVTKDNGDVDAITAATISSRAFLDAVNRGALALKQLQSK